MKESESDENWLSRRIEQELKDLSNKKCSNPLATIAFVGIFTLILLYLIAHQFLSTGFFNATLNVLAMLLLYGSLGEWIIVAVLETVGRKNISRDIDAFGGIIFVVASGVWLFAVFPFEFTYFANLLPESLRFLLQWISNDVGRGVLVLWIIINAVAAIYYGILRVLVRKKLSKRNL